MTVRATISNAVFDAACLLVPPPFGPLTRVGNLETEPVLIVNSHARYAVTGQGGLAFQISYDELVTVGSLEDVLREAYALPSLILDLKTLANLLYNRVTAINLLTGTPQQYEAAMNLLQYFRPAWLKMPVFSFEESKKSNKSRASFTVSGGAASRSVVNTSVGYSLTDFEWDWGDGTAKSQVASPAPHVYAVDGTYIITLKIGGRGGVSSASKSVLVDVP